MGHSLSCSSAASLARARGVRGGVRGGVGVGDGTVLYPSVDICSHELSCKTGWVAGMTGECIRCKSDK